MEDLEEQRWEDLLALLRAHPEARFHAADLNGLVVPLPPEWAALARPSLSGATSGIEVVEPVDHLPVIEAWCAALEQGSASLEIRELIAPRHMTRLHFFDLRSRFGAVAAVAYVTRTRDDVTDPASADETSSRPRLGRLRKDGRAFLLEASDEAAEMLGYPSDTLVGMSSRELIHPDDSNLAVSSWVSMLAQPGGSSRVRLRHRRGDGTWLWADVVNTNRLDDPEQPCVISELVDVSLEMTYREDARARERVLQRLAQALPVGLLHVSPTGDIVYTNERLHEILGLTPRATLTEQLHTLVGPDRSRVRSAFRTARRERRDTDLDIALVAGGVHRVCQIAVRPIVDDADVVEGVLVCVTDVTESVQLRAELETRATYDELTGCLNRSALLQRLEADLAGLGPGQGLAVVFLDLDGFKQINDTLGHAAGDRALRGVADTLLAAARRGDAVGRLGGDEFVVVCPGVVSEQVATRVAGDLEKRLARAAGGHDDQSPVYASVGVTWTGDRHLPADEVLRRADTAMYQAKVEQLRHPMLWQPETPTPTPLAS